MNGRHPGLVTEVINAVKPLLTQERRRGLLQGAFAGEAGERVLDLIDFTGANDTFAPTLVRQLLLFGEVEPGQPALVALLQSLAAGLGLDRRAHFNDLTERLSDYLPRDPERLRELVDELQIRVTAPTTAQATGSGTELPVRIEPVSGVIWFGRQRGEEKDLKGGRFGGALTVRASVSSTSTGVRVAAIELDCINEQGVYAAPLKQTTELVTDTSGKVTTQPLATLDGQFVQEIYLSPGSSRVLGAIAEFAARTTRYPYEWDYGFLRLRGFGPDRGVLLDVTYRYKGARSIERSAPPDVPFFSNGQLQLLLDLGYMNTREVDALKSIPPDERMLLLWDASYECWRDPGARKVVDEAWSRLHPKTEGTYLKTRGPIFPPPYPSGLGPQRQALFELQDGQHDVVLPSRPVRPDCVWVVVRGIYLDDCRAEDRRVHLSLTGTGFDVQVVYIEATDAPDRRPGLTQE
ncbi:hypothetical protein J0H58_14755 [bacterium]|nr:hypothetical protein [bacterium]